MSLSQSPAATIFIEPANASFSYSLGHGRSFAIALFLIILFTFFLLYCCMVGCFGRHRNHNSSFGGNLSIANNHGADDGDAAPNNDANNQPPGEDAVGVGLPENVINTYPKVVFDNDFIRAAANSMDPTCSICLFEYTSSEMLRIMPECRHYFHVDCVDEWLRVNGSCPVCRSELAVVRN